MAEAVAVVQGQVSSGGGYVERVAARVLAGDIRSAARLMRDLDDRRGLAAQVLRRLWAQTGRAYIVGITGNPGAGKSTVVDGLIELFRHPEKVGAQGEGAGATPLRVGVVSIDPTSPFSGGAILGDRIRMMRHATDEGVFIRSLATRGHLGGLSRSTAEVVAVLDAMGYDIILVETVGVGQGEVDIVAQADTTVVVTVPGLGDEVQAIKAGILEIADVLVVNKADREGADRTVRDLNTMLELRRGKGHAMADHDRDHRALGSMPGAEQALREPPVDVEIIRTVASRGQGLGELRAAIERHRARLAAGGGDGLQERRRRRAQAELRDAVLAQLGQRLEDALAAERERVAAVAGRTLDPLTVVEALLARVTERA